MPDIIQRLTDAHLARLLLRQLWQIQDAGGISCGRAIRNVFLESAIHIMPMPKLSNPDDLEFDELLKEAKSRKVRRPRSLANPSDLTKISDRTLAALLIRILRAWYRKDAFEHPYESYSYEMRITRSSLRVMPLPKGFRRNKTWTSQNLVDEAKGRYREYSRRAMDRRDRILWKERQNW